jgi:hypothetical protein
LARCACAAANRGSVSIRPSAFAMASPLANAEMLPRFPDGRTIQSGAHQSSCWTISIPTVFWPATRS